MNDSTRNGSTAVPLFLVGAPRSGTSFTKKVLRQHPKIVSVGIEHQYILSLVDRFGRGRVIDPKRALVSIESDLPTLGPLDLADRTISRFSSDTSLRQVLDALHECSLGPEASGCPVRVFQCPGPGILRHEDILGLYPEALFVVLERDPRGNVASQVTSLDERRPLNRAINLWKECYQSARRLESKHPDRTLTVRYEDLLVAQEEWLKKIVRFLGIDWDEALESFVVQMPEISSERQVTHRSFTSYEPRMAEKWRETLDERQIWLVEQRCRREMEKMEISREVFLRPRGAVHMAANDLLDLARQSAQARFGRGR